MALKDELIAVLDMAPDSRNEDVINRVTEIVTAPRGRTQNIDPETLANALNETIAVRGHAGGMRLGQPGGENTQDAAQWISDQYHNLVART